MDDPQLDLTPLFKRAFEILDDAEPDGDTATYIRAHIAELAQRVCLADAFVVSLDEAIAAATRLVWHNALPERRKEKEALDELEQTAKRRFFDGDLAGAEEAYLAADDLRDDHERLGPLGTRAHFLGWLLESGDLSRSVKFFQATDWFLPYRQVAMARRLADALSKAGLRSDGVNLLRAQRPPSDDANAHITLTCLGKALWAIDETQEGLTLIREAARASLARAARDVRVPLWGYSSSEPIALAQLQCTIGDQEGAVESLNGIMRLAAPVEYEPPTSPAPDPSAKTLLLIVSKIELTPASRRWNSSLPELIRVLARAGLDAEAFSLAASAPAGQLRLLAEVARGQARSLRGGFPNIGPHEDDRPV